MNDIQNKIDEALLDDLEEKLIANADHDMFGALRRLRDLERRPIGSTLRTYTDYDKIAGDFVVYVDRIGEARRVERELVGYFATFELAIAAAQEVHKP